MMAKSYDNDKKCNFTSSLEIDYLLRRLGLILNTDTDAYIVSRNKWQLGSGNDFLLTQYKEGFYRLNSKYSQPENLGPVIEWLLR